MDIILCLVYLSCYRNLCKSLYVMVVCMSSMLLIMNGGNDHFYDDTTIRSPILNVSYDIHINTETTIPYILWWSPISGMWDKLLTCESSKQCKATSDRSKKDHPDTHVSIFLFENEVIDVDSSWPILNGTNPALTAWSSKK